MRHTLALALLLASSATAQFTYDFNTLTGSDAPPFTPVNGQDNWTAETYNAPNQCGVTATLSHDGTQCLQFQDAGPGYGCDASRINDGTFLFPGFDGSEPNAMFQVDMRVGFWGGMFGLGYDTSGDGAIRGNQPDEVGVTFTLGTQANVQLRLNAVDGTVWQTPLANLGIGGGDWVRVRVIMDLTAPGGLGSVFIMNLTDNDPNFRAVTDLLDIPLGLDQAVVNGRNPLLWNAVWLHFEGATYSIDNIDIGRGGYSIPYGMPCSGTGGPGDLRANGSFEWGTTVFFESDNHEPNTLGVTIFGFTETNVLLDPILGTSNCFLYTDLALIEPIVASPTGVLSQGFGVPNGLWSGFEFNVQQACFEPVPGNLSTTNALQVRYP